MKSWISFALVMIWLASAAQAEALLTVLHTFSTNSDDSSSPSAGVVVSADRLYGSAKGGAFGQGTVYTLKVDGSGFTNLHSFRGREGGQPDSGVTLENGTLYGANTWGTTNYESTLFSLKTNGESFNILHQGSLADGWHPAGRLLLTNGVIYGAKEWGGLTATTGYSDGLVYSISTSGSNYTKLYPFCVPNGVYPQGGFILVDDFLYGITSDGGRNEALAIGGMGTIFRMRTDGTEFSTLHLFSTNGYDGGGGGYLTYANGRLYGITPASPGISPGGTLFSMELDGSGYTNLHQFTTQGPYRPMHGLLWANQRLHGVTECGGAYGAGTVFSLDADGANYVTLHDFATNGTEGYQANLPFISEHVLYGTTSQGGSNGCGTVFRLELPVEPAIIEQPIAITTGISSNAIFRVSVTGTPPLAYQWFQNGTNLPNTSALSTQSNTMLVLTNITFGDAGAYTVTVSNAGGCRTSSTAMLTLTTADHQSPSLSLTTPSRRETQVTNTVYTARGTAFDRASIQCVQCQLNGGSWFAAATTNRFTNWNAALSLKPGTNTFAAFSMDTSGNCSATNTTVIFCAPPCSLLISTNGKGSVAMTPAKAPILWNQSCILTARPAAGFVFSGWSGSLASTEAKLTFVVHSNLALVANFIPSPFTGISGTCQGLFFNPTNVASDKAGPFTITTTTNGGYSGKLVLGGKTYTFSGTLWTNGWGSNLLARSSAGNLSLGFTFDLAGDSLAGTVYGPDWMAPIAAYRAGYSAKKTWTNSTRFTLVLPGSNDSASQPGGDGVGSVNISPAGVGSLAASLADGTVITTSYSISKNGEWPLFASLYSGKGLLLGWLSFTNEMESDLRGKACWVKPAQKSAYYPAGFTNQLEAAGSAYALSSGKLLPLDTARLWLAGGSLTSSFTNFVTLTQNKASSTNKTLKLTLAPATGLFSGSVENPESARPRTLSFKGAVYQKLTNSYGYFLGNNRSGRIMLEK
jgi:uncharacterized repeat protein (TIGR03803 family)